MTNSNCGPDEKDISTAKFGAKFGVSVITIIYVVFIMFIIGVITVSRSKNINNKVVNNSEKTLSNIYSYIKTIGKGKPIETSNKDNITGRFTDWFTKVGSSINSGSVLAILAAGVVIGFNGLIMTPIISTIFPEDISKPIAIPGRISGHSETSVNPGQFFIALIGFILSLILFFFVAEMVRVIKNKMKGYLHIIIIILLFVFLTFMLIWNGMELDKLMKEPDCVPFDTKTTVFQFKNNGVETNKKLAPLPPFGVFG